MHRIPTTTRFAVAAISAAACVPASAQQPTIVPDDPVCAECRLGLQPVATLGDADGPGALAGFSTITQLADGRFVTTSSRAPAELWVFDANGRFDQKIGREGSGPGEFRYIRWVRSSGRGLHVFDLVQRRQTVYTSGLEVLRTNAFPGNPIADVLVLGDTAVVMNAVIPTRDRAGLLLHVFDSGGELMQSVDEPTDGYRTDLGGIPYGRMLAGSTGERFWAAHRTRYELSLWEIGRDSPVRRLVRQSRWFRPHLGEALAQGLTPEAPPGPRIMAIQEDGKGNVWTLTWVASPRWKEAFATASGAMAAETSQRLSDPNVAYDAVVELIDPASGKVIVSTTFDEALVTFIGDARAVSYSEATGVPQIRVWRITVQEPDRRR